MKRIASLGLVFLLIVVAAFFQPTIAATNDYNGHFSNATRESPSTKLDQQQEFDGDYYPVLIQVIPDDNADLLQVIRERNATIGEGAIIKVGAYNNVTLRYAVALSNTTAFTPGDHDFRIFADLPVVNGTTFNNTGISPELSLSDSSKTLQLTYTNTNTTGNLDYTLPYDSSKYISNATLYYYETTVELNISSAYIPFFAEDISTGGLSEADGGYNLLTIQEYWNTSSNDEFYIQNEVVNITASVYDANSTDSFGIKYRTSTNGAAFTAYTEVNATSSDGNYSEQFTLEDYEPVTQFEWRSYAILNDTLTNITRTIDNTEIKSVEIGDGTPELTSKIFSDNADERYDNGTLYTQSYSITFNASSFVPKGNISDFYVIPDTGEPQQDFQLASNQTYNDELSLTFDYSTIVNNQDVGQVFNATVYAQTDKNLSISVDYVIYVDPANPVITLSVLGGSSTIETTSGNVDFEVSATDALSGVYVAYIDFGDNTSVEVTNQNTASHRYINVKGEQTFQITLTAIDKAGNIAEYSTFITIQMKTLNEYSGPVIEFYLFIIGLVALALLYYFAQPVSEKLRDMWESLRG